MSQKYVISIDQSTQSTKVMLFDECGRAITSVSRPHQQIVDKNGWVEHNAKEIRHNVFSLFRSLVQKSGIDKQLITGIGITNQRESVVVWDRETGEPIYNAIVWQCNRAVGFCERLEKEGKADFIHQCCGLRLSPYASAPKITWILHHVEGAMEKAKTGKLCYGTMECWVIYCLTDGKVHKTDVSNASRTMLVNLSTGQWDDELCAIFEIPKVGLPEIVDSNAVFGTTTIHGLFARPVPILGVLGDSHSALYAASCTQKGMCMAGMGTGTCVMMNIGQKPIISQKGLLSSVAWRLSGKTTYLFDGVINYSGAIITWLYKDLGIVDSPSETETLAEHANSQDAMYLIPAFTGIGAPYWDANANAVICGMSRTTKKAEFVRAALDSMDYQVKDILDVMSCESGNTLQTLKVSGGPTKNRYLMQFLSDILGCPVEVPENEEMTLQGVALIAGETAGLDILSKYHMGFHIFSPQMGEEERKRKLDGWKQAIYLALKRS